MGIQRNRVAEDGETQLLDIEANSRIQILTAPIQLPGVCLLCGTSRNDDRQYIDLGLWIEMYGQIYFCTFCMTEMVNRLGGLTPEQAETLEKELDTAKQTILGFQQKEALIDGVVDTLRSTGLFSGTDLSSIVNPSVKNEQQDTIVSTEFSARNEQESTGTSNQTSESSTEQRPNDIPSSRSNELDNWL